MSVPAIVVDASNFVPITQDHLHVVAELAILLAVMDSRAMVSSVDGIVTRDMCTTFTLSPDMVGYCASTHTHRQHCHYNIVHTHINVMHTHMYSHTSLSSIHTLTHACHWHTYECTNILTHIHTHTLAHTHTVTYIHTCTCTHTHRV